MSDEQPDEPDQQRPDQQRPDQQTPDEETPDEEAQSAVDIDDAEEHVDARGAARETLGDFFTDSTTYGPAQLGHHNTQNNFFDSPSPDPIIGPLSGVENLADLYVRTSARRHLREFVAQRSVACLVGPRNSGRFTTARAALADRHGPGRIFEITLPAGVSPDALVEKPARLQEDSGFVLRLPGDGHRDTMRKLAALFRQRSATLVLIRDERLRRNLHDGEVWHDTPDPIAVFASHLRFLAPNDADRYLFDEVTTPLKAVYGPRESVALARRIAEELPASADAARAIHDLSRANRRERATNILLPDPKRPSARRAGQHERAFRLSYAVFNRRPLHYVFEATEWLLTEIDSAALRPDWGKMALQHPVKDLLGGELQGDWDDGRDAATPDTTRTAWIRDAGLRAAILDVAWHDFDGTRKPLLGWLDRMASEGDDVMRRAAAETAALIVRFDFDRAHHELVDKWAASPKPAPRQAAAWTMAISGMADDVGPRVLAKLSAWCSGKHNYRRDSAVQVYMSGLEQTVLSWSMLDLARIATDPMQRQRSRVARAVNRLYRPERASWILEELATEWARTGPVQIHAARALTALVNRVDGEATDGRPEILARLADDSLRVKHLGHLWRLAFLERQTANSAAHSLARWIRYASANEPFRRHVVAVLDSIVTTPAMGPRIAFYLKQTHELGDGLPAWARDVRRGSS